MTRPACALTFDDFRYLAQLVRGRAESHAAAARLLGINRPRLSRLIERVNAHLGEDLPWRLGTRFFPPPEARRIVGAFERFDATLEDVVGSPLISAGSSASMLLLRLLRSQESAFTGRLLTLRSDRVIDALDQYALDVALVNDKVGFLAPRGVAFDAVGDEQAIGGTLVAKAILEWRLCLIRPAEPSQQFIVQTIEWERHSSGAVLDAFLAPLAVQHSQPRIRCSSFLQAIELVRQGLASRAAVPHIYLRKAEPDLVQEWVEPTVTGYLVSIQRASDGGRWRTWLDPVRWRHTADLR